MSLFVNIAILIVGIGILMKLYYISDQLGGLVNGEQINTIYNKVQKMVDQVKKLIP